MNYDYDEQESFTQDDETNELTDESFVENYSENNVLSISGSSDDGYYNNESDQDETPYDEGESEFNDEFSTENVIDEEPIGTDAGEYFNDEPNETEQETPQEPPYSVTIDDINEIHSELTSTITDVIERNNVELLDAIKSIQPVRPNNESSDNLMGAILSIEGRITEAISNIAFVSNDGTTPDTEAVDGVVSASVKVIKSEIKDATLGLVATIKDNNEASQEQAISTIEKRLGEQKCFSGGWIIAAVVLSGIAAASACYAGLQARNAGIQLASIQQANQELVQHIESQNKWNTKAADLLRSNSSTHMLHKIMP